MARIRVDFERIDSELIQEVHFWIKHQVVSAIVSDYPREWDNSDTRGILFSSIQQAIHGIDGARKVIARVYEKPYRQLDDLAYFKQYESLAKVGRVRAVEQCGLHPDDDGGIPYSELEQNFDAIHEIAEEVAEGLEARFKETHLKSSIEE